VIAAAALLAGCASVPPAELPASALPAGWTAPLPVQGAAEPRAAQLALWWSQFDDPLLAQLIDAAQAGNGTLAQAAARIAQARAATRFAAGGAWPSIDAGASAARARSETTQPTGTLTTTSAGLDARWEIDLFGVTRNNVAAAQAREQGAQATWHDLRTSVAAEVASSYATLRACEALLDVAAQDAASQKRTADLTQTKASAGLESRANAALAGASAADASNRLIAQRADCDLQVKALVALTTLPESDLRAKLTERRARLPQPAQFTVDALPVQWLRQRPDLAATERDVVAAAREVGAAQADRWPRLSLAGTVSLASVRVAGTTLDGTNWSVGPALSLPLFDAGRRAASVDAARARYEEATARWTQRVRDAVREVEEALVRLDSATRRETDALVAAQGFRTFFEAEQARFDVGAGSLIDLEAARRNALAAAGALVAVQRERVGAWIALYKAVGGGWLDAGSNPDQVQVSQNR
jgi:NodT family efflux transporter outer membrane factor (OMF) lipoprotein